MEETGETLPTQLPSCQPTPLTMPTFSENESLAKEVLALAMAAVHGESVGTVPPLDEVEDAEELADRLADEVVDERTEVEVEEALVLDEA